MHFIYANFFVLLGVSRHLLCFGLIPVVLEQTQNNKQLLVKTTLNIVLLSKKFQSCCHDETSMLNYLAVHNI